MKLLLDAADSNGNSSAIDFKSTIYNGYGKGAVVAFGTWDTATITLQFSPDGTNWYAVGTDTTFTANGWSNFEINGDVQIRANLSSVGGSTSVSIGLM